MKKVFTIIGWVVLSLVGLALCFFMIMATAG
jgi:hypothetical protein